MYVATTRAQERLIVSGGVKLSAWPAEGAKAPPLAWLGPALLGGDLRALPAIDDPIGEVAWGDGARVRCFVNTPQTVGRVLREDALAPAGARLPVAPPPPPRPPVPEPAARRAARRGRCPYSRLAAWQACGYRYYLQRELGLPDEPRRRRGAGEAALRRPASIRAPAARSSTRCSSTTTPTSPTLAASWGVELERGRRVPTSCASTAAFADSPLARRIERARSVHREHAFTVALGDTLLTGVVDVLAAGARRAARRRLQDRRARPGDRPRRLRRRALRHPAPRLRPGRAARRRAARRGRLRVPRAPAGAGRRALRGRRRRRPGGTSCAGSPPACSPANTPSRRCRTASCA